MKILVAHNLYQQAGGEDRVFRAECALLESRGHDVLRCAVHNSSIDEKTSKLSLSASAVWNRSSYEDFQSRIRSFRPEVVHVHNTLPLISPAIYYAAARLNVPVVQTLHNFRLLCPSAVLYRNGGICESCVGKRIALPGIIHGCYRGSRAASAVVAGMVGLHRAAGTWRNKVDAYIACTWFARSKFIEGGLPAERIVVKPNFVDPDLGIGPHDGDFALFVGRLTPEKGIPVLLDAWERLGGTIPLKIAGGGPLLSTGAGGPASVEWLGEREGSEIVDLMKRARFLVFPSEWYEGFPVTLAEAFSTGMPVVATDLGAMAELITNGSNGILYSSGRADQLAAAATWAWEHPTELAKLGDNARRDFELKLSAGPNYERLMQIYDAVVSRKPLLDGELGRDVPVGSKATNGVT